MNKIPSLSPALGGLALMASAVCFAAPPKQSTVDKLMRDVPSNAQMVLTLNLEPSARQQQVFQLINPFIHAGATALSQSEDIPASMKGLITNLLTQDSRAAVAFGLGLDVGQSHNFNPANAMQALGKSARYGFIIPITNQKKVEASLAELDHTNKTPPRYWNGVRYHVIGPVNVLALSHTLVVASDKMLLAQIKRTDKGGKNFTQTRGYAMARARYDKDATVLLMTKFGSKSNPWGGGSLTLTDKGISLAIGPFSEGSLGKKPLPTSYPSTLPGGAYAILAMSESLMGMPGSAGAGAGAPAELLSLLKNNSLGSLTVALYPSGARGGKVSGADILLELAGSKTANPAKAVAAGMKMIQKTFASGTALFTPMHINGATKAGTLDHNILVAGKKGMMESADDDTSKALAKLLSTKTLCYATIGKSFIVSSSKTLIQKAVTAMTKHSHTMATDGSLGTVLRANAGKTYLVLTGDLKKIGDGLVSILGPNMAGFASIMNGAPAPVSLKVFGANGGAMATLYIPLTPMMVGTIGLSGLGQMGGSN